MGGGTDASWRCRKIRVMTDSWVMTAMMCREPRRQNGQVRISSPKTRPSSLVVYLYATDNSNRSPCGKIASFHLHERGRRHGIEPVVLPTPTGFVGVDLPHHSCLVA